MSVIVGEDGEAIIGREYQRAADWLVGHAVKHRAADAVAGVIVSLWSLRIRLPAAQNRKKYAQGKGLERLASIQPERDGCTRKSQPRAPKRDRTSCCSSRHCDRRSDNTGHPHPGCVTNPKLPSPGNFSPGVWVERPLLAAHFITHFRAWLQPLRQRNTNYLMR